jgi:bifunctional UDP-N-acetylglucosamine pyrophosphorylase/glucosamine-1-phosphate N-acetyltransferase
MPQLAAVILAAGLGKRMKSTLAKPLHPVCGRPMIEHVVRQVEQLGAERKVIVVSHQQEKFQEVLSSYSGIEYVIQEQRLGTGHAVMVAEEKLGEFEGNVLVLCGDAPLFRPETLEQLAGHHNKTSAAVTLLTTLIPDPTGYGRIIRDKDKGTVCRIIEQRDATAEEKKIQEINTGTYIFQASLLFPALHRVDDNNDQKEYYLTDVPQILAEDSQKVEATLAADYRETLGVNSRAQQAEAEAILQTRIRLSHMEAGVTLVEPATAYIDEGINIGKDTTIEPLCVFKGKTVIGDNCHIGPGVTMQNCQVGQGCSIGPGHFKDQCFADGESAGWQ